MKPPLEHGFVSFSVYSRTPQAARTAAQRRGLLGGFTLFDTLPFGGFTLR
jgi:hypothetical protein